MVDNNSPNIYKVFEFLKESYKYIDFREALFNDNGEWKSIVSIFRFSNKPHEEIYSLHKELKEKEIITDHFKIDYKIIDLENWEEEWTRINDQMREIGSYIKLDKENLSLNRKNSYSSWISEVDREYNSIQFNAFLTDISSHYERFHFLEGHEEIRSKGAESIYPLIKQTLQINNYNISVSLYSTFIFPTYIKISGINYINNYVSGKVEYHDIFKKSTVFVEKRYKGDSIGVIGEHRISTNEKDNKQDFLFFFDPKDLEQPTLINYENELQLIIKLYFKPLNLNLIEFGVYLDSIKKEIINLDKIPAEMRALIEPLLQYSLLDRKTFDNNSREFITNQTNQDIKVNTTILVKNKVWLLNNRNFKILKEFFISAANRNHVGYFNVFREFLVYTCSEGIKRELCDDKTHNIILNDIIIYYGLMSLNLNYKMHFLQESLKEIYEEILNVYDKYFRKDPDCRKNDIGIFIRRFNYDYPNIYRECRFELSEDITCLIYYIRNDHKFFNFNSIYLSFWYHTDSKDVWNNQADSTINNTFNFVKEIIDNPLIEITETNNIPSQLLRSTTLEEEKIKSIEIENEWIKKNRITLSKWNFGDKSYDLKRFNIFVGRNNSGKTHSLISIYRTQERLKIDNPSIQQEFRKSYPHHAIYEKYYIPRYRVLDKPTGKRRNPKTSIRILLNTLQQLQEQETKNYTLIDENENIIENSKVQLNLWKIPNFIEMLDLSTYIFEDEDRLDNYNKELIKNKGGKLIINALRKIFEEWAIVIQDFIPDIELAKIKEKGIEGDIFLELRDKVLNIPIENWNYYGSGTQEILSLVFIIEFLKHAPTIEYKQLSLSLGLQDSIKESLDKFVLPIRNNRVLLIDEPEISLHPSLQKRFFKYLYNSSKLIQIFIATNSPYFLELKEIEDHLDDDISIFLCKKDKTSENKFPKISIIKNNYAKVIDDIFEYDPKETAIFLSSQDYTYITESNFNLIELNMVRNLISKRFKSEQDFIELINLGTLNSKYYTQLIQNVHFLFSKPSEINLNSKDLIENTLKYIYIFQINQIQKYDPGMSNKERFEKITKELYDTELAAEYSIAKFKSEEASKILSKIENKLNELEKNGILQYKSILVFPEISIPYLIIDFLVDFARRNNIVIIGGLEHSTVNDIKVKIQELKNKGYLILGEYKYDSIESNLPILENTYINQAIIINANQSISFQIKNIPFRHPKFTEGIPIINNPFIRKFKTVFGNLAVFICKDFLVNYEIIDKWMDFNDIKLIIIPSFTSLVNPFRSKLNTIIHNIKNQDKSFIFINLAEFNGSGIFNYAKEKDHEPSMPPQFKAREEGLKKFEFDKPVK
jgi:predicted amidohydrolase